MKNLTCLFIVALLLIAPAQVRAEADGECKLIPMNELAVSYTPPGNISLSSIKMTFDFNAIGLSGESIQAKLYSDNENRPGELLEASPVHQQFEQKENVVVDFTFNFDMKGLQKYWIILYATNGIEVKTNSGNGIILNIAPYEPLAGQETRTFAMTVTSGFHSYIPILSR